MRRQNRRSGPSPSLSYPALRRTVRSSSFADSRINPRSTGVGQIESTATRERGSPAAIGARRCYRRPDGRGIVIDFPTNRKDLSIFGVIMNFCNFLFPSSSTHRLVSRRIHDYSFATGDRRPSCDNRAASSAVSRISNSIWCAAGSRPLDANAAAVTQ